MKLIYKDEKHKKAYNTFLEEAYLTEDELRNPSVLRRRQLAFLYLIALFQEDYIHYEGEAFYVEAYEEISLGGPTYLLDTCIGEGSYPHEKMLQVAKTILKGEIPQIPEALEEFRSLIECALETVE